MHHREPSPAFPDGLTALICGCISLRLGLSPDVGRLVAGITVSANRPDSVANEPSRRNSN